MRMHDHDSIALRGAPTVWDFPISARVATDPNDCIGFFFPPSLPGASQEFRVLSSTPKVVSIGGY